MVRVCMAKNPRLIDMRGQKVGLWTVIEQAGNTVNGAALWRCVCECGAERAVLGSDLRSGKSNSCGCEGVNRIGDAARKHGDSKTRLYSTWKNMRRRCLDPRNSSYKHYGGKGVTICQSWGEFSAFKKWSYDNGYADHLTIDRIDSNGDYCPQNCRWVSRTVQSQSRDYTQKAPDGEPWIQKALRAGLSKSAFYSRVATGWPIEEAALRPKGYRRMRQD